ncbi:hypothetical protein PROFUN_06681 [Planoprotostelium fungivorum]|uniref:protein-disulfide reductase n=1 Tax=Planoprotostelium fungivorum TaxID=1890364 RepID=A0A2P6NG28_9EUKA|nr:hypothetical protein PROFUN_06681 [Planoprotostelium fungivorum]
MGSYFSSYNHEPNTPQQDRTNYKTLLGDQFQDNNGANHQKDVVLNARFTAIYFSAHWCPPCRQFTPQLVTAYQGIQSQQSNSDGTKPFEVIFSSRDRSQDAFSGYFSSMPWMAIPYSDENLRTDLMQRFSVRTIPTLIVLGRDGSIITRDARNQVASLGPKAYSVWEELESKKNASVNE